MKRVNCFKIHKPMKSTIKIIFLCKLKPRENLNHLN